VGAPKVKDWYKQSFGADLPVSSFGLDDYHARIGLDHRNSFDVPLSPSSREGQALIGYLTEQGIPFRPITAEDVARGVKASGPHIHVGPESHAIGSSPMLDFSSVARDAPLDFSSIAQAGPDDEEVISTEATVEGATGKALALNDPRRRQRPDASTVRTTALSPAPALPQRESFDVRTMEGRQARDEYARRERTPGMRFQVVIPVSDITKVDAPSVVHDAYKRAAVARGVPAEFFDEWQKKNNPTGYRITDRPGGTELTAADAYDDEAKGLRLRLDAQHVSQIVDDYKAARGAFKRLSDWASSDETSPGEKVLDAAGATLAPVAKGAGYVARPFQAATAGVFSALRGHNPLPTAYKTFTMGETPAEGTNPVGNYLRDSAVLNRINPRLGRLLGGGADVLLDPANLIGLGMLGKGAKLVGGVGRVGRAADEVNALGRSLGLLERGLVEARPLELEAAAASGAGQVTAMEDRLSRVLEVTRKLKAGESLTPEESALHAEVKAAAAAAPSAAVRGEQLRYARERYEQHVEQAAHAPSRAARENAQSLADDYAKEIARLEGAEAPAGADGIDVHHSRFQPRTAAGEFDGSPRPLWKRAASNARAVVQLPKAKAGFDLSATGRQGLAQALAHPSYLKEAFARQVKAFASEDAFNGFRAEILGRPDFEQMRDVGKVFLSSVGPEAEEAFASNLADKIPGIRASDRAYSAALDSIRVQAWDSYVSSLPAHLRDNPETLRAVGELINISTGRGVVPILDRSAFGKKIINALNVPFFSPRNTASKFNLISPSRIVKNMASAETRPVALLQLRDASRGLTTLATTMGLMHVAGLDVGHDPHSSDFGKLRVGKAVYDLTGGEAYTVRYLALMAEAAAKRDRAGMAKLTGRYLRTQLQPATGSAVDWWKGKNIAGQRVTSASAALNLITPFVVDDVIKGFQAEGLLGAAKATPGVLGVGVNFYDKPRKRKR
jgi:hypothetical protein